MLRRLADGDFDGRRLRALPKLLLVLNDGLDRVPQEFAYDVFDVAEDIGEVGFQVPLELDLRRWYIMAVRGPGEVLYSVATPLDHVFSIAL